MFLVEIMSRVRTAAQAGLVQPAFIPRRARRPISKHLISVTKDALGATTQATTTLFSTTYPGTVTGIRWNVIASQLGAAAEESFGQWAIVVVEPAGTADTLADGDAATFYPSEGDCLVWGQWNHVVDTSNSVGFMAEGSTKTMRRLNTGDTLQFVVRNGGGSVLDRFRGMVQFFIKT